MRPVVQFAAIVALDHATSEIASDSKPGIDAMKKIPGEGFKRAWPPLIRIHLG
jgi:4-hydroxy-3-polyprenylbenzoate decarboxylase